MLLKNKVSKLIVCVLATSTIASSAFGAENIDWGFYSTIEALATKSAGEFTTNFDPHQLAIFFSVNDEESKCSFHFENEWEHGYQTNASKIKSSDGGKMVLEKANVGCDFGGVKVTAGVFQLPMTEWDRGAYVPYRTTQLRPGFTRKTAPFIQAGYMAETRLSIFNLATFYTNGGDSGVIDANKEKAAGGLLELAPFEWLRFGGTAYLEGQDLGGYKKATTNGHLVLGNSNEGDETFAVLQLESSIATRTALPVNSVGDSASSLSDHVQSGYYAQLLFPIGDWKAGARQDYYDPNSESTGDAKTTSSAFVNLNWGGESLDHNFKLELHSVGTDGSTEKDSIIDFTWAVVYQN